MTRAEYNAKVQELQAMWPTRKSRVHPSFYKGTLMRSEFQVRWDGRWQTLGTQKLPFDDDATYAWDEGLELRLRSEFAAALIHS